MVSIEARILSHQEHIDITNTIQEFDKGSTRLLDRLVNQLSDPGISSIQLAATFRCLDTVLEHLDRRFHTNLFPTLLSTTWYLREDYVVESYSTFITGLLAVHNCHLPRAIDSLVRLFIPTNVANCTDTEKTSIPVDKRVNDQAIFVKVHALLEKILREVPRASIVIENSLKHLFPSWRKSAYEVGCFAFNLLRAVNYLPDSSGILLDALIHKIINIDAHLCVYDIRKSVQDADVIQTQSDDAIPIQEDSNEFIQTLDMLVCLLFRHFRSVCYDKQNDLNWCKTKSLYKQLLTIFDNKILSLGTLQQIQFFMFYICSFKSDLAIGFIDYLWKRVQNPNLGYSLRQNAIWYLTDFLARAKYINLETLIGSLDLIANWCVAYTQQKQTHIGQFAAHQVFYSVCQSLFFLVTFRHADLLEDVERRAWCREHLHLQTLVASLFNPLNYSNPVFAQMFSDVTRTYEVAYCSSIIEDNRNCRILHSSSSTHKETQEEEQTTTLKFPFQEYLLPSTASYIVPLIREFDQGAQFIQHNNNFQDTTDEKTLESHLGGIHIVNLTPSLQDKDTMDEEEGGILFRRVSNEDVAMSSVSPPSSFLINALNDQSKCFSQRTDDTLFYGNSRNVK